MPDILAVFGLALLASSNVFAQTPSANFTATPISGCSPLIVQFQDLSSGNPTSWSWDLGNGSTSTLQHPQTTYFLPGTYSIRVTVTNANGSNTLTRAQYVTVYGQPTVNFSADQLAGCFPLRNQFTDLSTSIAGSTIVNWQWDFGNGLTSSLQNPSAIYPTAGTFAVTLKVTDDKGCSKILGRSSYIDVSPGVTAAFAPNPPIACVPPATITFNNTSGGPGTLSYTWDFGDGGSSSGTSPSHIYGATGSYTASLVVASSSGCSDTVRRTVSVGGFTSSFQTSGTACPGSGISFTNTSTPNADSVRWTFGNGNSSTEPLPANIYQTPGTYTVWLYNYYGNCIDSTSQQLTVNTPPLANFTASNTGTCQPALAVNFQDLSSGAVSWQWDFGDGNTSSLQNPAHTYNGYGNYNVTLVITNGNGCLDTLSMPDFIRLQRPVITVPQLPVTGCIPFTFSPVPVINSPDGISSFLWDFGDGNTSTLQNPTHIYPTQGTYTVKLYYTSSTGCTDSITFTNGVRVGAKPVADLSATPLTACASETINFTNLSAPFDQLLWNFGDGVTSSDTNPTHVYTDTGYFNIQLIASNNGCSDTVLRARLIQILPPISRFSSLINCINRLTFNFTDESILPQTWLWDFGDGTTSTQQNPEHVFPDFGTYSIRLTVTNGSCSHTSVQSLVVAPMPVDFTVNQRTVCKGLPVVFTLSNINAASTVSTIWIFGDGTQSPDFGFSQASHVYADAGTYTVTLISVDKYGCRDTMTKAAFIQVYGPVANFSATPPGGCSGNNVVFTDQSVGDGTNVINNWLWDFGDGSLQSFNSPPFTHVYTTNDTFSVKLMVTDAAGCRDSITRPSYIITTRPQVAFEPAVRQICAGAVLSFTNTSPPSTSFWDFGDGNTSTAQSPTHSYTDTGFYSIKLVITDSAGCTDSLVKTDYVHVILPQASFMVNDSFSACTPLEVQFTNTSKYGIQYQWDFGIGEGNSSLENPMHYYSTPGTYRVKLTITSPGGCQDSAFINITVLDTAGINLSYTPIDGCNPLLVNFAATGPISTQSYFWDFGDGTQLTTTPTVSHVYQEFGNYLPKLILLDPPACVIPVTAIDTIRIRGANVLFGISDSLLCDAGFVTFSDSTTSSEPITAYTWNFGDGNSSAVQSPTHYYSSPGNYDVTLTVTTQSGCSIPFAKPMGVRVIARPNIAIEGDSTACIYDSIRHTGLFIQPDTSAVTWQWTFPNGNSSTLQNPPAQTYQPGSYTIFAYATNSDGCVDTATKNLTIYPLPTVSMPGQMTIAVGFSDTIPASYSNGVNQWNWTPPYALSCLDCPRPVASPKSTTTYQVAFSDINGCRNTGSIEVVVICKDANFYIPNTFSPNGDGSNDRFYPRGRGLYLIRSMRVFNRWGETVFENRSFQANDANAGWDGRYKGNRAQPDVYVYQVEIQCDNGEMIKLTGNIALIL